MAALSLLASAAHRWERARRWLLLANPGPVLARYAPADLPTPDPAEEGLAAVQIWARWRLAERLDAGFAALASIRVEAGGESFGLAHALGRMALEADRDAAAAMLRRLASSARAPALELGSAFARAVDLAAERGAPQLIAESEVQAARQILAITEEPVRDVLSWATLRAGRPRRARVALGDVLRVLRNEPLDELFHPANDPWQALSNWRHSLGNALEATTELARGLDAWPGSWALRGRRSRLVGTSGWPGALRARFALQGLGRLDSLAEGGHSALLPRDPAAAQLLATVYPMFLPEVGFLRRVFAPGSSREPIDADAGRLTTLAELLLQRAQAAVVELWWVFEQSREVEAVLEASSAVSRALFAQVPPELVTLLAAPWTAGLSGSPGAVLAAATLIESWRESFDEDYWRNPRFGEPLRALASRSPHETLAELVPQAQASGVAAYTRWVDSSLGR